MYWDVIGVQLFTAFLRVISGTYLYILYTRKSFKKSSFLLHCIILTPIYCGRSRTRWLFDSIVRGAASVCIVVSRCLLDISYRAYLYNTTKLLCVIRREYYYLTQRDFPLGFRDRTLSRQCTSVRRARGMDNIGASYMYIYCTDTSRYGWDDDRTRSIVGRSAT